MTTWILSGLATSIGLLSSWYYGKKSILGAWLGLHSCVVWLAYIGFTQQWPLLISVIPNIVISVVNIWRMMRNGRPKQA